MEFLFTKISLIPVSINNLKAVSTLHPKGDNLFPLINHDRFFEEVVKVNCSVNTLYMYL